jgi:hypothetical protein
MLHKWNLKGTWEFCRRENNIKMDLRAIWRGYRQIQFAQDKIQWPTFVDIVMNLQVSQRWIEESRVPRNLMLPNNTFRMKRYSVLLSKRCQRQRKSLYVSVFCNVSQKTKRCETCLKLVFVNLKFLTGDVDWYGSKINSLHSLLTTDVRNFI